MDILIYSALNVIITPMYGEDKKIEDTGSMNYGNHVKGDIQIEGIPIFLSGKIIFDFFQEKKIKVIPKTISNLIYKDDKYDNYVFHILWQTFFNSLIFNNFKEILVDDGIVALSLFINQSLK